MHLCKLSAYEIYKNKNKGKINSAARFGIVIHDILEEYGLYCIEHKEATNYHQFEIIKFNHLPDLDESQIDEANQVLDVIKNNFNWSSYLDCETVLLEKRFLLTNNLDATENEDESHFSSGIDLLYLDNDIAYVEDYKTVRAIYTKTYMRDSLQRKIYSYIILKHFPQINEVKFRFNFVRYGYQSEWLSVYREELEDLQFQIQGEIQTLEKLLAQDEAPEANPGGHCVLCPVHGLCKAYQNAYSEIEKIETREDAERLYQRYRAVQVQLKEIEGIIKFYVTHNPPIELQYEIYGPQEESKIEFPDTEKLIEVLTEKFGIPTGAIYDKLNLSKTNVTKLLQKFRVAKEDREKVFQLAVETKITKIKTKKKEEESSEDEDGIIDPYI